MAEGDPELAALYQRQRVLQDSLAALRAHREEIEATVYEAELERLLLDLAQTAQAIRERGGDGDAGGAGDAKGRGSA
jgi:hypothetical protein